MLGSGSDCLKVSWKRRSAGKVEIEEGPTLCALGRCEQSGSERVARSHYFLHALSRR